MVTRQGVEIEVFIRENNNNNYYYYNYNNNNYYYYYFAYWNLHWWSSISQEDIGLLILFF